MLNLITSERLTVEWMYAAFCLQAHSAVCFVDVEITGVWLNICQRWPKMKMAHERLKFQSPAHYRLNSRML